MKRWIKYLCMGMLAIMSGLLHAQDALPQLPPSDKPLAGCDSLMPVSRRTGPLPLPIIHLPEAFKQVADNQIADSIGVLAPFWEKLRWLHLGLRTDTLHIVHVGDSHIRGHVFPRTAGERMQQTFGAVKCTDVGINGAFCTTFTRPDRIGQIVALHPDLLILSFGTNESHNRKYDVLLHYQQMDRLVRQLRQMLPPDVPILMTTPPGSYESQRQSGRRRIYKINPRTSLTVQTILHYAWDNGLAVWNMYQVFGGSSRACLNWQEAGLMRPDHIHYLPEGYVLQGELFFQALLKAYNDYVENL